MRLFPQAIFLVVGLGLLVWSWLEYGSSRAFLATSLSATGTVIDLVMRQDSDSSDGTTYHPLIRFATEKGEQVEFLSPVGSYPSPYQKGQEVLILYNSANPYDARESSWTALWGPPLLLAVMGTIFAGVGGGIFLAQLRGARRRAWLQIRGQKITAEVIEVDRDTSLRARGRSPYRILAQWQDPLTGKVHIFKSERLWFNPQSFLTNPKIEVYIDSRNPKKYFVDISSLPKLA